MAADSQNYLNSFLDIIPDNWLGELEHLMSNTFGSMETFVFYLKSSIVVLILLVIVYTAISFVFFDA